MCAQYTLKTKASDLALKFGIKLTNPQSQQEFDLRVQGYLKTDEAPVIRIGEDGNLEIALLKFSLCPSWSKEFPTKFTTYNARMERENKGTTEKIYEVPTWKESFTKGMTCLVPMNEAIESSYFGKSGGNIVRFGIKGSELYFVAGLWAAWTNKATGEVIETFTLITDDPYQFFYDHGHDRSVFVLNESAHADWLKNKSLTPVKRFNLLRKNRISLAWTVAIDRKMKSGWEKRAPSDSEINQMKVWAK